MPIAVHYRAYPGDEQQHVLRAYFKLCPGILGLKAERAAYSPGVCPAGQGIVYISVQAAFKRPGVGHCPQDHAVNADLVSGHNSGAGAKQNIAQQGSGIRTGAQAKMQPPLSRRQSGPAGENFFCHSKGGFLCLPARGNAAAHIYFTPLHREITAGAQMRADSKSKSQA